MNKKNLSIDQFIEEHKEETISLLKELASIPAPSHQEEKRGKFCLEWLKKQGADSAYVDEMGNVIFPYYCKEGRDCVAVMAHMDVVFPDTKPFKVTEEEGRIAAPGIGDDTANLVNLLMCVKYVLENQMVPSDMGILFVANTCEEGLGNLKGTKAVFECYGERIKEMLSFDIYLGRLINSAVGSHRYLIKVKTRGGHSYADFGEVSAIQVLAGIIQDLYKIQVPESGKTTYNAGMIEGGTSINTIAQSASVYYEFRSDSQSSLAYMEKAMWEVISLYKENADVQVELLGVRPCGSDKVPKDRMEELVKRQVRIIEDCTGKPVQTEQSSTDANIPLSIGIPAVTFGTVSGAGAHTYEEWIEKESMIAGQKAALTSILYYFMKS